MSGGDSKAVELFDLLQGRWSALPELKQARKTAGSCDHGGYIYVFGGGTHCDTNTIERLSKACLRGQASNWELIRPDASVLLPRSTPAVVSLDARTYMIFGGANAIGFLPEALKSTNTFG